MMRYWNRLLQEIVNANGIMIYGAGLMGQTVKKCLEDALYDIKLKAFIVESLENNPDYIENVPVLDIDQASPYLDEIILVALHEKNMLRALKKLEEVGFRHIWPLSFDSDEWSDIRGNWFLHRSSIDGRNDSNLKDLNEILTRKLRVYVAYHVADRVLKEEMPKRGFEIPIQVGAALTSKRIAAVLDNQGENISEKNKKYCELTALYWIWKHEKADYLGLCHYRRRFDISEQMAEKLPESGIDVVVTVPVLNIKGVKRQYCDDHIEKDWEICMKTVVEMFPQYGNAVDRIQRGNYYYAYNMLIARREILNRYCEWLFPILFQCEREIGERSDSYQGRYLGFLAERLMTIFFEHHKDDYKIAIARKHFIPEDK